MNNEQNEIPQTSSKWFICVTQPLFPTGLSVRIWPSQARKPHRCARWVKSKLHSQPRPAATNVTTLQTLPLPSHRCRDNLGTLRSACCPSSFCLLLLSTIVLLACSKWSESKLKTMQISVDSYYSLFMQISVWKDFARPIVTLLLLKKKKAIQKTFTSWNV